ncbi:MAG: DUF3575 domain-containing protein [Bacteroidota bacterium]|nr:DUF3575 domain-containing protein [Bacteroidota bacterium]
MKKAIGFTFLMFLAFRSMAQVDVTINPIGLLFGNISAGADIALGTEWSVEPGIQLDFNNYKINDLEYKNSGFGVTGIGKYYFNPEDGADKWNIGVYTQFNSGKWTANDGTTETKVTNNRFSVGFYTGYKWVSRRNIVFELGFGVGRAFVNDYSHEDDNYDFSDFPLFNIDFLGKLAVGYRFGSKS